MNLSSVSYFQPMDDMGSYLNCFVHFHSLSKTILTKWFCLLCPDIASLLSSEPWATPRSDCLSTSWLLYSSFDVFFQSRNLSFPCLPSSQSCFDRFEWKTFWDNLGNYQDYLTNLRMISCLGNCTLSGLLQLEVQSETHSEDRLQELPAKTLQTFVFHFWREVVLMGRGQPIFF